MRSRPISASSARRFRRPTTTTPPTRSSRCSTTINGDLSDGHKKLREGLAKLEIDAPNGKIKLDDKRQAIAANFVTEVVEAPNGDLTNKMVKFVPEVRQTMGFTEEQFAKLGLPSRTNPECKKSYN